MNWLNFFYNKTTQLRHPFGRGINASISPNINFINTPNDRDFNVPGYTHSSNGFEAGFSISYKKGRNEIEAGCEYSKINYAPRINTVEAENSSYYLYKIEYDNIKIPFNYKYHFFEDENWDIYSVTGGSANIIVDSEYKFNVNGKKYSLPYLAKELQESTNFSTSLYAKKEYNDKKNTYFAINAGIGVKRKLKKGLSVFVEPQYNHPFNQFGPNEDGINTMNVKFGVNKMISL